MTLGTLNSHCSLFLLAKGYQSILKKEGVIEVSNIEADLFMRNLSFEVAKLIGKLELQTGTFDTVKRTTTGAVCKTPFFGSSFTGEPS